MPGSLVRKSRDICFCHHVDIFHSVDIQTIWHQHDHQWNDLVYIRIMYYHLVHHAFFLTCDPLVL